MNRALSSAAHSAMIAAQPVLAGCAPLNAYRDLPERVLLHAGPAYDAASETPQLVVHAAISAAMAEGWTASQAEADALIRRGDILLRPAQDFGVVTPLAFVVGPGTAVLQVVDAAGLAPDRCCPVNDGPPDAALRFGAPPSPRRMDRRARLRAIAAPLDVAMRDGIALLPLMAAGLAAGDDLHGQVSGVTRALAEKLLGQLDDAPRDYVEGAGQFGLNAVMGACAVLLAAAATVKSDMVCAAGGNGVDFGWQRADAPGIWHTAPALRPVGPLFADLPARRVLPAIGDSAVIDACGFGAAILRHAPTMRDALAPFHAPAAFDAGASAAFFGPHPSFPHDVRLGLRAEEIGGHPGIMLAMLDAAGHEGLVGRGIAPWPVT